MKKLITSFLVGERDVRKAKLVKLIYCFWLVPLNPKLDGASCATHPEHGKASKCKHRENI